jgi:CNT family concentrative nucleoside transporter
MRSPPSLPRRVATTTLGLAALGCLVFLLASALPAAFGAGPSPAADPSSPAAPQGIQQLLDAKVATATPGSGLDRLRSALGIPALVALAWAFSTKRRREHFPWRVVLWGLGLQLVFAVLVLKSAPGEWFFQQMNDVVKGLLAFSEQGARFVFGNLVDHALPVVAPNPSDPFGNPTPVSLPDYPSLSIVAQNGSFFAFNVLPTILFFSSLMAVLYHLGLMQLIVRGTAFIMFRTMKTSGAETLSAAANIFVGQTEAPLVVRPYIEKMTASELHCIMTGGFANVAGGVLAAYVAMLAHVLPDIAGHLIAASVMSAPASLVFAKLLVPETEHAATAGDLGIRMEKIDANSIDAAARGASEGLQLALNVAAMLISFLALVALVNAGIGWAGGALGAPGLTLERLAGYIFWPMAWILGVPASECAAVGQLLGVKTILNEFVAYLQLRDMAGGLSHRSLVIASYALCGFANLGSIGIQLGGIGALAPGRRSDLARLGLRAMCAGALSTFLCANVAGILVG